MAFRSSCAGSRLLTVTCLLLLRWRSCGDGLGGKIGDDVALEGVKNWGRKITGMNCFLSGCWVRDRIVSGCWVRN